MADHTLSGVPVDLVQVVQERAAVFWPAVSNQMLTGSVDSVEVDHSNRALARLRADFSRRRIAVEINRLRGYAPLCQMFPSYRTVRGRELDQFESMHASLVQVAWDSAEQWLAEEPLLAFDFDEVSDTAVLATTYYFMMCVTKQFYVKGLLAKEEMLDQANTFRIVQASGGARHYVRYAVAWLLADSAILMARALFGHDDSAGAGLPLQIRGRVAKMSVVWTDLVRPIVRLASTLPPEQWEVLVSALVMARNSLGDFVDDAAERIVELERARSLSARETATHRSSAASAQQSLDAMRRKFDAQCIELQHAQALASARPKEATGACSDDTRTAIGDLANALREVEQKRAALDTEARHLREELAKLRAFTSLLLSDPGAQSTPAIKDDADVRALRIVVVGGHERLHSKLRRELPNAVCLHPDRRADVDDFEGAEVVLFCAGYCSHALSWFAAKHVRNRGLLAGYTNHTNVELVLEDIHRIVRSARTAETRDCHDSALSL